jgi:hypothetical protein
MAISESRKPIGPGMHAVLDYGTAAGFFGLAVALRNRDERASRLAWINGASVLLLAMFTDYPGGLFRRIAFKTHRTMDMIQAGMSAAGPALLGFGGEPEARPFYVQTAVEATVIGTTDWDAAA